MSKASEILQRAFEADPSAMHALLCNRVPCNDRLSDDPYVIVDKSPVLRGCHFSVGMMGVLNGILVACDLPRVSSKWSADRDAEGRQKMEGFCDYSEDEVAGSKAKALFGRVLKEIDLNMQEISSESVESPGMQACAKAEISGLTIARLLVQNAMKEL
jgi:hypothetical protein